MIVISLTGSADYAGLIRPPSFIATAPSMTSEAREVAPCEAERAARAAPDAAWSRRRQGGLCALIMCGTC
jgi:hypothetical protein